MYPGNKLPVQASHPMSPKEIEKGKPAQHCNVYALQNDANEKMHSYIM